MELNEIANIKFYSSDLGEDITIKEYLKTLLLTLWKEEEGFSGKHPLGNSGWKFDIYIPLIGAGVVQGLMDDEGFIDWVDAIGADQIIADIIRSL